MELSFVAGPAAGAIGILLDGAETTKIKPDGAKAACQSDRPIVSGYNNSAIVYQRYSGPCERVRAG
jgi:hypothetical protein